MSNVVLILAKDESGPFKRCSFPLLGRPVFAYPILAGIHAKQIDHVFVSTPSKNLIQMASHFPAVTIIERTWESREMNEEIYLSLNYILKEKLKKIDNIVILLGNSPCILSETIDQALERLNLDHSLDAVISVEKMDSHRPSSALKVDEQGLLQCPNLEEHKDFVYFPDWRVTAIRSSVIQHQENLNFKDFSTLPIRISPLIQDQGVADIDYLWQVPMAEYWLKKSGFSESQTPYLDSITTQAPHAPVVSTKDHKKIKVFISTVPFGEINPEPLNLLRQLENVEYTINPLGRKLREQELADFIEDVDILIAGTEQISAKVLDQAQSLKLISRVGIGLDSVDLNGARQRGITVAYTPDAPAPAVAELTMGHMLNLSRWIPLIDRKLREGVWQRLMGYRLAKITIGIIGVGRIGSKVLKHLQGFSPLEILINDIEDRSEMCALYGAKQVSKEDIFERADIISLHIPLTPATYGLVGTQELNSMKKSSVIINTSRGGIIKEKDLFLALKEGVIRAAAIDVFEHEPYGGELLTLDNCITTCHIGSCSEDCRFDMELQATQEAIRFIQGEKLLRPVPEYEYQLQEKA